MVTGRGGIGRAQVVVTGVVAVAAVAAVVIVTGIGLGHRDDDEQASRTETTGSVPEQASAGPAVPPDFSGAAADSFGHSFVVPKDTGGQPLPQVSSKRTPADPDWLTASPGGTNRPGGWQQVYGGPIIPFSTTDGPARIDNGVPRGFTKTPQGAALAAEQIYWRTAARPADQNIWQQLVILTPEELADRERKIAEGAVPEALPERAKPLLFASDAFRIESYGDDFAVVRIARKTRDFLHGGRSWLAMRLTVLWRDGAWKLKSSASDAQPLETIGSIDGWTQW